MNGNFTKQIIPRVLFSSPLYMPCWLCRIPASKFSYAAKMLYGRMAYLSDSDGILKHVHVSCFELIGMDKETLEVTIKELLSNDLIRLIKVTNNDEMYISCEFYDHEWMNRFHEF